MTPPIAAEVYVLIGPDGIVGAGAVVLRATAMKDPASGDVVTGNPTLSICPHRL